MRFIVALLIASLFVDKADSELSFIPRHNLDPCASYSPGVRSQKYSHPYPLTSIPRASYPFSFNHGGGASQNRKTHIGFRDNQARTDDFHHVKVTLYRWVISLPCPHREIELTNPKAKGRETQRHYSCLEQLEDGTSFRTITDTKIMGKFGFNCQLRQDDTDQPLLLAPKSLPFPKEVPSLFHFHSRVLMCFHASLKPRKMDKFLFLGTHTAFVTPKRIMVTPLHLWIS